MLGQDARNYDSMEGIGRVELGTETENNAGAVVGNDIIRYLHVAHPSGHQK